MRQQFDQYALCHVVSNPPPHSIPRVDELKNNLGMLQLTLLRELLVDSQKT